MMAESGTFAGTVNANGGVRVPLPATAQEALSWANATGLITGTTGTTLSPQGSATRDRKSVV